MQNTQAGATDWYVKKTLNPETPTNDFYESFYSTMPFIYDNKIYDNEDGQLPNFSFKTDTAYHIDAIQFGHMLRDKVAIPNGVVHIQDKIVKIEKDNEGYVGHLELKSGDSLEADLFIDCTGFKSLLLGGAMDEFFEDFSDWLPNKKAITCHVPYTDKDLEMENVTNCTAWDNGWIWNIPLYNRIGAGYVYDAKYLNKEEAEKEFKEYLNSDRMKIHNPNRSDDIEKFDHISAETHWRTLLERV
jgi:tryptophan halogenase